jgi:hypothetical protein
LKSAIAIAVGGSRWDWTLTSRIDIWRRLLELLRMLERAPAPFSETGTESRDLPNSHQ